MEKLIKRSYIFASVLLIAGACLVWVLPRQAKPTVNEAQMNELSPERAGGYVRTASYRMDDRTYALLQPYGIVGNKFTLGSEQYDVVLIAGNDKENFHDPKVCLPAQDYFINQETEIEIPTQSRGVIHATLLEGSFSATKRAMNVIYFYKGKGGFYPRIGGLGLLMFKGLLKGELNTDIVFYRFMSDSGSTVDEMKLFVAKYVDAANESSKGFF